MSPKDREQLVALRKITGISLSLKEYEEFGTVQGADNMLLISLVIYDVKQTARETRYLRKGWKIITVRNLGTDMTDNAKWRITDTSDPIWDTDWTPVIEQHFSKHETQAEITAREEWEKLCHRPGTKHTPMDNLDRKFQGYDYSVGAAFYSTQSQEGTLD